jgi:hypothetical protein
MKKLIYFLVLTLITASCMDCEEIEKNKRALYCNIIVNKASRPGRELRIHGFDPVSRQRILFVDISEMYFDLRNDLEMGDTLVKNKGELDFFIHKKDTVLVYHYKCLP